MFRALTETPQIINGVCESCTCEVWQEWDLQGVDVCVAPCNNVLYNDADDECKVNNIEINLVRFL